VRSLVLSLVLKLLLTRLLVAQDAVIQPAVELRRFAAAEATQAVAVDDEYFYAIGNRVVAKYAKQNGEFVKRWQATPELPLEHLNSGIVLNGLLYCAHSNFPHYPETSSIEVWDTRTLEHIRSHSLGIYEGSLTWIDWYEDAWWAVFAHYSQKVNDDPHARDARWTSLVKFDRQWRRTAGWVFLPDVIERFEPHSCSGGSWGPNGLLYCTGHDRGELYELALPRAGATLRLTRTLAVPIAGQGFAWDRGEPGILYGIDPPRGEVVVVKLPRLIAMELQTARRPVVVREAASQLP